MHVRFDLEDLRVLNKFPPVTSCDWNTLQPKKPHPFRIFRQIFVDVR